MALDTAPKLTRRRNVAIALETTTGTAASLSGTDGVTPMFDPAMPFSTEEIERDSQGTSFSAITTAKGARAARFTARTEMFGGATDPIWTRLLRASGMTGTGGVYTPVTGATETATVGYYQSGILKRIVGAMFDWTMTLRRGQLGMIAWDGQGVQAAPSDTANISPTYVNTVAPRIGMTLFTIGGTVLRVPEIVIAFGNTVTLREDVTAVDAAGEATGYRAGMITNRRTLVRMSPEATPLSTRDWNDIYRDSTLLAMACEWGVDDNGFEIAAPKLQLVSDPTEGDRNGLMTNDLVFLCTRGTDAGEDDFSLTLKQGA